MRIPASLGINVHVHIGNSGKSVAFAFPHDNKGKSVNSVVCLEEVLFLASNTRIKYRLNTFLSIYSTILMSGHHLPQGPKREPLDLNAVLVEVSMNGVQFQVNSAHCLSAQSESVAHVTTDFLWVSEMESTT